MTNPSSLRVVHLVDGRLAERPLIEAQLYRDYPLAEIENVELQWAEARERAGQLGELKGLAPLEHEHWDWRNKADSIEALQHMLLAVECEGEAQGLMAVSRVPQAARLSDGHVVYVDYVESAPWNLRSFAVQPRYLGVGTVLIAEAARLSLEMGLGGIGLHSLPQAEAFYTRCQMTKFGPDPAYFDLPYFENTREQAAAWLASLGISR